MDKKYVISVLSKDRVGIIADITMAIKNLGGNLDDLSQTVLQGYFTMLLLSSFPENTSREKLLSALHAVKGLSTFEIGVMEYVEAPVAVASEKRDNDLYVVTASGPDSSGLVAAMAEYLRQKDINVVDLTTKSSGGKYTMMFLVKLPADSDVGKLNRSLQIAMADYGLKTEIRHQAIFKMTNEI